LLWWLEFCLLFDLQCGIFVDCVADRAALCAVYRH
jgi:hypothetical protein